MEHFKNKVLTIAGSDSGAGAGIQADLKTFAAIGVYGASVLTAVTAQNSIGVQDVRIMDEDIINSQIDSVLSDIGASAVKTGMLANSNIIKLVSKKIKEYKIQNLIVDPVMVSESGDALLEEDAVSSYVQDIIPKSVLVTPNILEAEKISKINISSEQDVEKAGKKILDLGAKNVLIKGGHFKGNFSVDFLFRNGTKIIKFKKDRVNTQNTHGTGCTLSAAIAAYMTKGESLEFSIRKSKEFLTNALKNSYSVGKGPGPVNHFFNFKNHNEL